MVTANVACAASTLSNVAMERKMLTALIGPIANLAGTFLQTKVDKQKAAGQVAIAEAAAKAKVMETAATHDSKWELLMAQGTQGSWKDELVTIVVLIPCVLVFIPGMEDTVKTGFELSLIHISEPTRPY